MFLLFCLLCLRFAVMNIAAEQIEPTSPISVTNGTSAPTSPISEENGTSEPSSPISVVKPTSESEPTDGTRCQGLYPLEDLHLESQGIYSGSRVRDKLLVFEVSEKSVLTVDSLPGSNETLFVRKTVTVRDDCTLCEKTLSPNLTELLEQKGDVCLTGPSQGTLDVTSFQEKTKFMAVWTFFVPAKQCFALKLLIRQSGAPNHDDRLTVLDGELAHPFELKSGVFQYDLPPQNETTVSVVYFYTSLGRSVYWKMAPSLKTSDCLC